MEDVGAVEDLKDEQDDRAEDERAKHRDCPPVGSIAMVTTKCVSGCA